MAEVANARTNFSEELVRQVKDLGQELINNAEQYVPNLPYITDFEIVLHFGGVQERCVPSIEVVSETFAETNKQRWCDSINKAATGFKKETLK